MVVSFIFFMFTTKFGEDEPQLTCAYFSDGLVKNHQPDDLEAIIEAIKNSSRLTRWTFRALLRVPVPPPFSERLALLRDYFTSRKTTRKSPS